MKIGILRIEYYESDPIDRIRETLCATFPRSVVSLIQKEISLPSEAFSETREQYRSAVILEHIRNFADSEKLYGCILGIVDVDLFAPSMSYVFGEAEHPGKAALISLTRLRPEFYQQPPDHEKFLERSAKEAIHEIGHTFGLDHCDNPFCVMHFSNSILETDVKKPLFCNKCASRISSSDNLGENLEREI